MRALMVRLPSGARYWTVVDDELVVVPDADDYLRHLRFGRDSAELTTKSYAGAIALFLRWCRRTGRHWHVGVEHLGLFMTWLTHAAPTQTGNWARCWRGPGRRQFVAPGGSTSCSPQCVGLSRSCATCTTST